MTVELNSDWIESLSSQVAQVRANSVRQIYAAGRALAEPAVHRWLAHRELRELLGAEVFVTVGLAVTPEMFAKIRQANGWPRLAEVPSEQDAVEFELQFERNIALDVLTSREPNGSGAIARFLSKLGEGVQQVEFRCSNVDRASAILDEHFGVKAVYPETRPGADGTRVNFFLMAGPDGKKVLIELYEPPPTRF